MGQADSLSRDGILRSNDSVQGLEAGGGFLLGDFHAAYDDHALIAPVVESELHGGLDAALPQALGIMDEALSALVARGQTSRDGVFEGLDDGGLAAAVGSHYDGQGEAEGDDLFVVRGGEGADSADGEFGDGCHGL